MMKSMFRCIVLLLCLGSSLALAQQTGRNSFYDAARGPTPINEPTKPPPLGNSINDDLRQTRNYAMQPPVIPHRVDGYQVDKDFNKCLDCHARSKAAMTQAVPVSITHYMDREGRVLGQISTRRYFCQQCHVPQDAVAPIVGNNFKDVDTVIRQSQSKPKK